jgi:4-hydroxythreonine-4-phosphate dehydrogenase
MQKKKIAISIGDLNGIGIELALSNHHSIRQIAEPIYCIDRKMAKQAATLLQTTLPDDFDTVEGISEMFKITPGTIDRESGRYSYASFLKAVEITRDGAAGGVVTLPIHKKAWELAGISYKGHTDALRDLFKSEAIMMLGSPSMYVALFTEHIPLREVADRIDEIALTRFLLDFHHSIRHSKPETRDAKIAVLGLNPHAGDGGVLGNEERSIEKAIAAANHRIGETVFVGPLVPDVAFIPQVRKNYLYYVAMYHDQGLAPLKALYFDEGINVSLNLPILRSSVDHGTAFDIAYKSRALNNLSYLNAVSYIVES